MGDKDANKCKSAHVHCKRQRWRNGIISALRRAWKASICISSIRTRISASTHVHARTIVPPYPPSDCDVLLPARCGAHTHDCLQIDDYHIHTRASCVRVCALRLKLETRNMCVCVCTVRDAVQLNMHGTRTPTRTHHCHSSNYVRARRCAASAHGVIAIIALHAISGEGEGGTRHVHTQRLCVTCYAYEHMRFVCPIAHIERNARAVLRSGVIRV